MTDDPTVTEETYVVPDDADKIIELEKVIVEQNNALIQQLNVLGRAPNMMLLIEARIEALVDMLFSDSVARQQYDCACHLRINGLLKQAVADFSSGGLIVPPSSDGA